jgi:DNA-binding MarR family transcriptional regulator
VLAQLHRHGSQTVGELVHDFGHKRSTLTNILDRLEERVLIARTVNPHDRRSFTVSLTRSGAAAAAQVSAVLDDLERAVRRRVSGRDLTAVRAIADALAALGPAGT